MREKIASSTHTLFHLIPAAALWCTHCFFYDKCGLRELKKCAHSGRVVQLVGVSPAYQKKAVGSIPNQGTFLGCKCEYASMLHSLNFLVIMTNMRSVGLVSKCISRLWGWLARSQLKRRVLIEAQMFHEGSQEDEKVLEFVSRTEGEKLC